jgi:hypothetical protein
MCNISTDGYKSEAESPLFEYYYVDCREKQQKKISDWNGT